MSGKTMAILGVVAVVAGGLVWYARSGGSSPLATTPKPSTASRALAIAPTALSAITSALGLGGGSQAHQSVSTPPPGVAPAPGGDNPYGIVTDLS